MPRKPSRPAIEPWEVELVKAMLARRSLTKQDILAYFTRPTRSINPRVITEISLGTKGYKSVGVASESDLQAFLLSWPNIDSETGLSIQVDELLVKAREAMIAAVHTFNSAGLTFRAEIYITTAVIAWTYLLHAYFRDHGVDYRYVDASGAVVRTREGADKYWDLSHCLREGTCPLSPPVKKNLEFLLGLRHEIEHRATSRIDDSVGSKLQACSLNFNEALKRLFGVRYGLERRLPLALQFVTFDTDQVDLLKRARSLPRHVETMVDRFEGDLSESERNDRAFAFRVAYVPISANRPSAADEAIHFVKAGSPEADAVNKVLFKLVDRPTYTSSTVARRMRDMGYKKFSLAKHTKLWQSLGAKNPKLGFGKPGLYAGSWEWYDSWLTQVAEHCSKHAALYGKANTSEAKH